MLDPANPVPSPLSASSTASAAVIRKTTDATDQTHRFSQASELTEWSDVHSREDSHGERDDFVDAQPLSPSAFSPTRLATILEQEVDLALTRLPGAGAPGLRSAFLTQLDQRLAEISSGLDQPGAADRLDTELTTAQTEMDALLAAVQPAPMSPDTVLTAPQDAVLDHLLTALLPEGATRDELVMLYRATRALVEAGVDTPGKVDALLQRARRHDINLSMLASATGQLGFGVGFVLFVYLLAPALAPSLMGRGFWPAFGFGYCAGTIVGFGDAVGTSGAQNVATGMAHADDPAPTAGRIGGLAAISLAASFVKNCVSRVLLPTLAMELLAPGGMQRDSRNIMDLWVDCAGGPPAGALGAWLRAMLMDSPQGHALRLLSTADLDELIENVQRPLAAGDFGKALKLLAVGLGKAAVSPSTHVVVFGVVAPMIGLLLAAHNAVPAGTMLVTQAAAGMGSLVTPRAGPISAIPVGPTEHAIRAGISTTLMSLMAGMATAAGSVVGPRIDAPTFRCYLAALRAAMAHLRTPVAAPEPGLRRRSVSQA